MAIVYVRQSSMQQVLHHEESQRRQRGFVERAMELGWPADRIHVLDEDLGKSGSRSGDRGGFEQMVAMVALGKIGIVLALEVSRLARSNRDWYHLLDVCSICGTLIADEEGLYHPALYNDRLLLGLKGTMSEAELHLIKQRLVEAMRAKAKRGELRRRLPPGYAWDEAGRIRKDPDEQIVASIEEVFRRFERLGSIHQTHLSLVEEERDLPVRHGKRLIWRRPTSGDIQRLLENPVYAGAYVYGRRQVEEKLDESLKPKKRMKAMDRDQWHALLKDHHEGYISWEQFEGNLSRIASNRRGGAGPGAPREGGGLLQGLVLCGRCGRRMRIAYGKGPQSTRYSCSQARKQTGAPVCQDFGARRLEGAVEALLLECLSPLGMGAMLKAAELYGQDIEVERTHWDQKVQRARYEAHLARRQYDAVDPENRLVGRELERRFEEALRIQEQTEAQAQRELAALEQPFSAGEQKRLRFYASNLAALWEAPTTRAQDRKRIARCLIEAVTVNAPWDAQSLTAKVHWKGGEVSTIELPRGKTGVHRYVSPPELVKLIRTLSAEFSDEQIARILYRKKLKTPKGHTFKAYHVANVRNRYQIPPGPRVPRSGPELYTAQQAAEILGVTHSTAIRWVEGGLLRGTQLTPCAPWRIVVTKEDIAKLKPTDMGSKWKSLKAAAVALGISQQGVLQKLNSGKLEGVRVGNGRRVSWRIHLPERNCDDQPTLF
jgi:DNA invertase Pin-like site-specific DNA recombinase